MFTINNMAKWHINSTNITVYYMLTINNMAKWHKVGILTK